MGSSLPAWAKFRHCPGAHLPRMQTCARVFYYSPRLPARHYFCTSVNWRSNLPFTPHIILDSDLIQALREAAMGVADATAAASFGTASYPRTLPDPSAQHSADRSACR